MSLTTSVWLSLFVVCVFLSFKRSIWAFAVYWLTFYASPNFWWWGGPLSALTSRWNLVAAGICLVAVISHERPRLDTRAKWCVLLFGAYVINATMVHFALASNPERSADCLERLWKCYGLFLVALVAIRDRRDLTYALWFILLGSAYVCYEIIINDRGTWTKGRLELAAIPEAGEANALGGLLATALPIGATFLLARRNKLWQAAALVAILVFLFESILRCNSRSVFLGMFAGCAAWLALAKGESKKKAILGLCLVAVAASTMIKSDKIVNRFKSTFASSEERDGSAGVRLKMWSAAMEMVGDHPFGSGGESAFRSPLGNQYAGRFDVGHNNRAVHNGLLDIATGWGLQGLALYLTVIAIVAAGVRGACVRNLHCDAVWQLFGASLAAQLFLIVVCAMFASTLDNEWIIWWLFLSLSYARISEYEVAQSAGLADSWTQTSFAD